MEATLEHIERTTLGGCIVSLQFYPSHAVARLAVNTGGKRTFPVVTFYRTKMLEGFKVRDNVTVSTHMQLRVEPSAGGGHAFSNLIVADGIRRRYRAVNDFLDVAETRNTDGGTPDDVNSSYILGEVSQVYVPAAGRGNIAIVGLKIRRKDGRETTTEVTCFRRQAKTASGLGKGDTVALCGFVSASDRTNETGRAVQSIVCRDIVRLAQAAPKGGADGGGRKKPDGGEGPGGGEGAPAEAPAKAPSGAARAAGADGAEAPAEPPGGARGAEAPEPAEEIRDEDALGATEEGRSEKAPEPGPQAPEGAEGPADAETRERRMSDIFRSLWEDD